MDEEYKNYVYTNKYTVSEEFKDMMETPIEEVKSKFKYPVYRRSTTTSSIREVNIVDTLNSADLGTDIAARLRNLDIKVKEQ